MPDGDTTTVRTRATWLAQPGGLKVTRPDFSLDGEAQGTFVASVKGVRRSRAGLTRSRPSS